MEYKVVNASIVKSIISGVTQKKKRDYGLAHLNPSKLEFKVPFITGNRVIVVSIDDTDLDKLKSNIHQLLETELVKDKKRQLRHKVTDTSTDQFRELQINNSLVVRIIKRVFDPKRVQREQITKIKKLLSDAYIAEGGEEFVLNINGKKYKIRYEENTVLELPFVSDENKTEATADCVIKTCTNTSVYISLKGNTSQQWSGISKFNNIEYPEIVNFINDLKTVKQNDPSDNKEYYREIKSEVIRKKGTFGIDYSFGSSIRSANNVNHILVGETIELKKQNSEYVLTTNMKIFNSGDDITDEDYKPYIISRNDSSRNDGGVSRTRILIFRGKRGEILP